MTQYNPSQGELHQFEQRARQAVENNNPDEAKRLLKQARELYDRIRSATAEFTTGELSSTYVEVFEKLRDYKKREGIHSEIAVPMVQGDKVIGVIHLNYSKPRQFTDSEFEAVESFAKQTVSVLSHSEKRADESLPINSLILVGDGLDVLTPRNLATKITPYLNAISDIQDVISDVLKQKPHEVRIRMITQNSPISVSLDGAAEAVHAVQETVIPWRRKHAEKMSHLQEQEKLAEIENKKAEVLEKRASAAKSRAEAEKFTVDAAKQREEIERMKLENEKLRLEVNREKIQLALNILNQLSPQLSETERIACLIKLLPPLDVVIFSNLETINQP